MEIFAEYGLPGGTLACIILCIYKYLPIKLKRLGNVIDNFTQSLDKLTMAINKLSKTLEYLSDKEKEEK